MKKPKKFKIGDGNHLFAYGVGEIPIRVYTGKRWEENKHLSNVHFIPKVKYNLVSYGAITNRGYTVTGNNKQCLIHSGKRTVMVGEKEGNLYKLKINRVSKEEALIIEKGQGDNSLRIWHERLAHLNLKDVKQVLNIEGIKATEQVSKFLCKACVEGKMHRLSFPTSKSNARKIGELIHADLCGPMEKTSIGNSRYFLLFKDDYSKYRKVYFLKNKSEVLEFFRKYRTSLETETGEKLRTLRTDNGLEFINWKLKEKTDRLGIRHERTVAYTPEQNGRAERENRTLVEAARSMMLAKGVPKKLWAEAVNTAAYVLNRVKKEEPNNKSPYELWHGKQASIRHLKVFGTKVYVHIPKQKRLKWDAKATKGIHVGYGEETKGYRIWYPSQKKVDTQRDVIFEQESKGNEDKKEKEERRKLLGLTYMKKLQKNQRKTKTRKTKKKHKKIRLKRKKRK